MTFDAHTNFAYSTVLVAPSPATSGTNLTVQSGQGAIFPTPPFNVTVWPPSVAPTTLNAEIMRVTGRASDVFTVSRAQESTINGTIAVGYQIAATVTAKTMQDIETAFNASRFDVIYLKNTDTGKYVPTTFIGPDGSPAFSFGSEIP